MPENAPGVTSVAKVLHDIDMEMPAGNTCITVEYWMLQVTFAIGLTWDFIEQETGR